MLAKIWQNKIFIYNISMNFYHINEYENGYENCNSRGTK